MKKLRKFTFKTIKPKGPFSSFHSSQNLIKFEKAQVGLITDKFPHKIRLMVFKKDINEDSNPNCEWKWIEFKRKFDSVYDAKVWINKSEIIEQIHKKHNLHKSF